MNKTRVLLAPLDWGLGHTTRCIPIINTLLALNAEVILAAENASAALLKAEFPQMTILPLKGYRIRYARRKKMFFIGMLSQFPKIRAVISAEHHWLKKTIEQYKIDAVISDNRFGLYHKQVPCVYITHQLFIETNNDILNKLAQKIHYRIINRFSECWVPDQKERGGYAGKLSHPLMMPRPVVRYLGILSRCKKLSVEKTNSLLIILSGPEPQRSIFENILLQQIAHITVPVTLVRGLPGNAPGLNNTNPNLTTHDHLPAAVLNQLIQQSGMILARCGYSTVMDLAALGKQAILVPTPGQAEQEYLAAYLKDRKLFFTVNQEEFSLSHALDEVKQFLTIAQEPSASMLEITVKDWLGKIAAARVVQ